MGAGLLILLVLPWYRLLEPRASGPAAEQTLRLGAQYYSAHWAGAALALVAVVGLSLALPSGLLATLSRGARRWLVDPPVSRVAATLALVATILAAGLSLLAYGRAPILQDGFAQLIHARYLADGRLTGPALDLPEFWQFQFMTAAEPGWASQYPPGFTVVLAAGSSLGAAWLVGPLLLGVAVGLATLAADRLLPDDRAAARLGAGLMAISPFLLFHAATFMSHVLALALLLLALLAALAALDRSRLWALGAGAALGAALSTRPWTALVIGPVVTLGAWVATPKERRPGTRRMLELTALAAVGAAPLAAGFLAYNARVFGHPLRLGYVAVAGPSHGLGFGVDPWGSPYGPLEAVGSTATDLLGMSLDLLQSPLPVALLVGAYLLLARAPRPPVRLLAAWALLPVAANALYWHHDLLMGPRLLYEAAPAWCLLAALASLELVRRAPDVADSRLGGLVTGSGTAAMLLVALLAGVTVAGPAKLASYTDRAGSFDIGASDGPTLVFVHEDWESRLGARMSALGMRLDSIRLALRLNSTCRVEVFVASREALRSGRPPGSRDVAASQAAGGDAPMLRFEAGTGPEVRELLMPSGAVIRTYDGEVLTEECERQAASDFNGVVALPPLLWRGDLPDLGSDGAMFVRDLGRDRNAELIERLPDRVPKLLVRRGSADPTVLPYDDGMRLLWPLPVGSEPQPPGGRRP